MVSFLLAVSEAHAAPTVARKAGQDRYETSKNVVLDAFTASDWAVVCTGESFADALSATGLAGALGCPLVLTQGGGLSEHAAAALRSLGVKRVYLMGGESQISDAVAQALSSMGIEVIRVAGADRYATANEALAAARAAGSASRTLIIASGVSFPDALSVGPWAFKTQSPVLLVGADGRLSQSSVDAVRSDPVGFDRVIIVGGTAVVSDAVRGQLREGLTFVRLAGPDRYATSVAVAEWATSEGLGWAHPAVVSGTSFSDALSAAPAFGLKGSPVLLASDKALDLLARKASSISSVTVVGGPAAVSDAQRSAIVGALGGTRDAGTSSDYYYSPGSWYSGRDRDYGWTFGTRDTNGSSGASDTDGSSGSSDADDAYVPTAAAEADDPLELWTDEEDVLIRAQSGSDWAHATNKEQGIDELDVRASQVFYAQGPSNLASAPQLVRVDDNAALGAMQRMSEAEVNQLDKEYSGGDDQDILDHSLTYWKLEVKDLLTEEKTVTYQATAGTLASDPVDVDYWLPFTTGEVDRMGQVDAAIANLVETDAFWANRSRHARQRPRGCSLTWPAVISSRTTPGCTTRTVTCGPSSTTRTPTSPTTTVSSV